MDEEIAKIKLSHFNNYKKGIEDVIINNTNVLFDEDIKSLLKKPPLDSMDLIKNKFLMIAKKNKVVLNTETLNDSLEKYRHEIVKILNKLKKIRISNLNSILSKYEYTENTEIFKLNKKDFNSTNKEIKSFLKEELKNILNKNVVSKFINIFPANVDEVSLEKMESEIKKYLNGAYIKQLLENIDFKVLVKDTILINAIKEQGERYQFTLENSHMFYLKDE